MIFWFTFIFWRSSHSRVIDHIKNPRKSRAKKKITNKNSFFLLSISSSFDTFNMYGYVYVWNENSFYFVFIFPFILLQFVVSILKYISKVEGQRIFFYTNNEKLISYYYFTYVCMRMNTYWKTMNIHLRT